MSTSPYDDSFLEPGGANFVPLSPLSLLKRSAAVYPDKVAVVHGRSYSYSEFSQRSSQLASALAKRGIGLGDTVAVMAANTPPLLEAHYGVPAAGAVLNALNTRLDAATISFILDHADAKALITDREYAPIIAEALKSTKAKPFVIDIDDPLTEEQGGQPGPLLGEMDYEAFLKTGDPDFGLPLPEQEWQAICLNYTSGTTGNPKGVVYHHRGAYLNALGNSMTMEMNRSSVYLWTLPMFHCNGWTFTWAVTAAVGTHVCCRRVDPALVYRLIEENGVTHMCGAPIVLNMLAHADSSVRRPLPGEIKIMTGGAAPPSAVIENMESQGFSVIHAYGLTESYGPATYCAWQEAWDGLNATGKAEVMARQGVRYTTLEGAEIRDPQTLEPVPYDGETMGELMLRGNTVMKGYLKNPQASADAFQGGWFHTGDLGVQHPDGYIEIKDRSKDVIISGGENISSLEVEEVLYRHPKVLEAAVVAKPSQQWGETPCAFVTLKNGQEATGEEIISFCKEKMARFKAPSQVVFGELPKTSTGKIQKYLLRDRAKDL